jgi:hypothetical protein
MRAKNSIERTQNRRGLITTPFPTPEEAAVALGLSPERHAELKQMLAEIRAEDARRAQRRSFPKQKAARPAKKK